MKKMFFLSLFLFTLGAHAIPEADEDINFIGLDEAGKEIEIPVKSKIWKEKSTEVLNRLNQEISDGLSNLPPSGEKLEFHQFNFGAEVRMSVGIGDFVKATINPFFYLVFSK
jgi:hypothetical protein